MREPCDRSEPIRPCRGEDGKGFRKCSLLVLAKLVPVDVEGAFRFCKEPFLVLTGMWPGLPTPPGTYPVAAMPPDLLPDPLLISLVLLVIGIILSLDLMEPILAKPAPRPAPPPVVCLSLTFLLIYASFFDYLSLFFLIFNFPLLLLL